LRLTEGAPSPPGRVTLAGSRGFLALSCGTPLIQVVLLPEERDQREAALKRRDP